MKAFIAVALLIASASPAWAFHEVRSFTRTANTGGGAGYYYTGSPRFKGYDCTVCHNDGAGQIRIALSSTPPGIESGQYEPGTRYTIDITLAGEHRGLGSAFNPNTFALEILDDDGATQVGALSVPLGTVMEMTDGDRIAIAEGFGNGETEWRLFWEAPAAGAPATLYIAMLDGDGASDPDTRTIDAINDDVVAGALRLCPVGSACPAPDEPTEERAKVQCAAADGGGQLAWLVLVSFALIRIRRRRCL